MESSKPSTCGQSMALAEVYRVIYNGFVDHLRGAIVTYDKETGFQPLFKDTTLVNEKARDIAKKYLNQLDYGKEDEKLDLSKYPTIEDGSHILPNGPTQMSIGVDDFYFKVYLFRNFHRLIICIPNPHEDPDVFSTALERTIMSDDGNQFITLVYALFEKAVEAHIKVKFTGIKSDFGLYGVIAARTSAIVDQSCSSILFFHKKNEKMQLEGGHNEKDIQLLRSIVAVPLGSKLALEFALFTDDNKICQAIESFDVVNIEHGFTIGRTIPLSCEKVGTINVEIKWRCQRDPNLGPVPRHEWSDEDESDEDESHEDESDEDESDEDEC